jgi:hypothetical protein
VRYAAFVCFFLALSLSSSVLAQDCRDGSGEPVACPAPAPAVVATPAPPAEPPRPPTVFEREGGYYEWGITFHNVDLRPLHLTPQRPEWVPELARGLMVHGRSAPHDVVGGGITFLTGFRPVPFLRFPELRFTVLGGEIDAEMTRTQDGSGLSARPYSFVAVRAELGIGVEAHAGPVGFFATARAGIAGYFVEAALEHPTLGDFGRAQLAEDALELGWEVAMSYDFEDSGWSIKWTVEGNHLGAESLGSSFRIVSTF